MLVKTAGFLPAGGSARLMTVITQSMKGKSLEGRGCEQRLNLQHSAQGRDQGGQADREERQVESRAENGQGSRVKFTKQ